MTYIAQLNLSSRLDMKASKSLLSTAASEVTCLAFCRRVEKTQAKSTIFSNSSGVARTLLLWFIFNRREAATNELTWSSISIACACGVTVRVSRKLSTACLGLALSSQRVDLNCSELNALSFHLVNCKWLLITSRASYAGITKKCQV